ncbi:MAG: hypothetical protein ACC647_02355 [Anaerolineales bacterium]
MDNQLMLGILLIIVGIAVSLIAVALVLNRRENRMAAELELESEAEGDEEPSNGEEVGEQPTPEEDEQGQPSPEGYEEDPQLEAGKLEALPDETPRERRLVAEIYREDVTGKLVVRSGDHEYRDGKEIENEAERRRLAYAASDLADWFQGEFGLGGRPAAASTQPPSSPDRMLEEINEILQRSLAGTPDRGVRLVPDTVTGVKVLIGVKSYEIEEVPDEKIKELIRQAVAEWEARQ